jgi:hypothetical protein
MIAKEGWARPWHSSAVTCALAAMFWSFFIREAAAQSPTLAEALFRDARAAMKQREYDHACALFSESYRLDATLGTLFNLAVCEQERGRVTTAWATFKKVVDLARPEDERAAGARERARRLEPELPRLTIVETLGFPGDVSIELDGVVLGRAALGTALPVDPGEHLISLKRSSTLLRTTRVRLSLKESLAHRLEPGDDLRDTRTAGSSGSRKEAEGSLAARAPSRATARAGYAALGLGLGAVGGSSVLGLLAIGERNTMRAHCSPTCDATGRAAAHRGDNLAALATAFAVTGAVGLGVGGVFVWRSRIISFNLADGGRGLALGGTF